MIKWLTKFLSFFDRHPWDWGAHIFLGLAICLANYVITWLVENLIIMMTMKMILGLTICGAVNFVIAVELTQWDIFGISRQMLIDSAIDFAADMVGIGIGYFILIVN